MTFSRLMRMNSVTVNWTSRAGSGVVPGRAPDLVIAQDVTPSMSSSTSRAPRRPTRRSSTASRRTPTRARAGAFVKFSNIDAVVQPLVSYTESPYGTLNAANGTTAGLVHQHRRLPRPVQHRLHEPLVRLPVRDQHPEPGERAARRVGQAIIFVTDGATDANDQACKSAVTGAGGTQDALQTWLQDSARPSMRP
jgi:hypothetical protein